MVSNKYEKMDFITLTKEVKGMPYQEASVAGRRDSAPALADCLLKNANWCGVSHSSRSVLRQRDFDITPLETGIKSHVTDMPAANPAAVERRGDRKVKRTCKLRIPPEMIEVC